ncbi:MAG: hypothetical protein ACRDWH_01180 [Acidimicrobiia bacterium]
MPFTGELISDEHERPLKATIDISGSSLILSTGAGELGRWPLDVVRIEPHDGRFVVSVEGDSVWFSPDDPVGFTREVLDRWGAPTLATAMKAARAAVVPRRLAQSDSTTSNELEPSSSVVSALAQLDAKRKWQIGAGLVGVVLLVWVAGIAGRNSTTEVILGNMPTTTTVPTTPLVFQSGLDQIAIAWNEAASKLGLSVFMLEVGSGNRLQMPLTGDLVLYGTEDPQTRTVRTLMISTGPTQGEEGTAVLAVWGNLIAVVNPELDPAGRRAVLDRLGVDVNRPLTLGLDVETIEGGARYWLRSGVLGGRVHFGVEPNLPVADSR